MDRSEYFVKMRFESSVEQLTFSTADGLENAATTRGPYESRLALLKPMKLYRGCSPKKAKKGKRVV